MIGGNKGLQTVLYSLHAMLYVTVHGQCCIFIFHNFYCDTNTYYVFFMNMNKSKLCMWNMNIHIYIIASDPSFQYMDSMVWINIKVIRIRNTEWLKYCLGLNVTKWKYKIKDLFIWYYRTIVYDEYDKIPA